MRIKTHFLVLCALLLVFGFSQRKTLPDGFIYAKSVIPDLDVDLRYYSSNNFVADTIDGYHANRLILTKSTVKQLKLVQEVLRSQGLCLRIYDGYRPQRAVNHFIRWAKVLNDTLNKHVFYPKINKRHLFKAGYIASRSGHSRGSTVDLTLVNIDTGEPLDMGSPYDYFGEISSVNYANITAVQKKNRQLLQTVMHNHNFRGYAKEWWHFTLRGEAFPDTYFDFEIK